MANGNDDPGRNGLLLVGGYRLVVTVLLGVLSWIGIEMNASIKELKNEFSEFRVDVSVKYAPRSEVKEAISAVNQRIDYLMRRLDNQIIRRDSVNEQ